NSYYIVNGIAVTATKEVAEKIATFAEVEKILPNETRELFTTVSKNAKTPQSEIANVEWNVERVGAPAVWDMGFDGTGTVVASIDTGVQWDHPALKEKYRGYDAETGEVDHDFNWYDATANQETPYDDQGHGTHVTGTMVGSEPDGENQVGVAPGAKWIAVKAFTAAGGTDADLLDAAEWILAPTDADGNTRVDLAPDVVNNSWGGGPGLDEWYRDVVQNWRAADIFPEFSAGNTTLTNPGGPGSIATPANYPESFATGATDANDDLASFSLEGPSPYEGDIKPDISAPGVNIRSSVPGGAYEGGWNGTSMAGPAVSAVVALLIEADASLTVDELEEIIMNTAT
ncbi:peptidase S8, partial [Virgibacillus profundi]